MKIINMTKSWLNHYQDLIKIRDSDTRCVLIINISIIILIFDDINHSKGRKNKNIQMNYKVIFLKRKC